MTREVRMRRRAEQQEEEQGARGASAFSADFVLPGCRETQRRRFDPVDLGVNAAVGMQME